MSNNTNKDITFNKKIMDMSRTNKLLFVFIIIFAFFVSLTIITWVYFQNKSYKRDTLIQELNVLQSSIVEKKSLRDAINSDLSDLRFFRLHHKDKCNDAINAKEQLEVKYNLIQKNYNFIKYLYSLDYVFGEDVSGPFKSIIKLSATNNNICIDGDYDLELRKLQWKVNVGIDDALVKETQRVKAILAELK